MERKHVDTDNTIVRERTRREEERKYFEVQSFVSYRQEPQKFHQLESASKKSKTIGFRLYLVETFATLWKNIVEV